MLVMTQGQMSAGQEDVRKQFVENLSAELAQRYALPLDGALRSFVRACQVAGLDVGFETDRQIADFTEACFLTRNALRTDPDFLALMKKPLMRSETKAAEMLRRWVWSHPSWVPDIANREDG
ncbi:hypothetical protein HKX62_16115 [Sulfitobacter sp. M74]|nr:hypothetical protein [Sulfitobacter sp. KE42]MDF3522423.1 hypothetical protein [Sulfitobacter sp. M74]